ncbi:shikimate dehydrogenase [Sphingomonas sp.]|uniref:shikimate dehydrogenase family protein n=1 Tax=Sphingomonas sp. TaxID=28214 RepID=UPI00286B37F5|nr:shikimate dehydrogenase [Sphingomonas sp.]
MTSAVPYAEVIGDPIVQSKSPAIHRFWLDVLEIKADYRATRVTRADFKAYLANRRADPAWRGCNVTMPLKLDALFAADDPTDRATATGAANLLTLRDGKLVAANTDVGAVRNLLAPLALDSVIVLGNGGAARAILLALKLLGSVGVRLQARDMAEATSLCVEFGLGEGPRPFNSPIDSRGLINATPLGMAGIAPIHIDLSTMPADGWVLDLVSAPLPTPLLSAAAARGLTTIDGLCVLVEQAAGSFELLFGQKPPRDRDALLFAMLRA